MVRVFRVASSLDSMVLGEPQIIGQVKAAWQLAQKIGSTGRFLDAVMQNPAGIGGYLTKPSETFVRQLHFPYSGVALNAMSAHVASNEL